MKKKYLLLLLLPFVTFSQSVFSPKSNPNSLGIAKSFGDNNSIDKPINLPFEKLHFVDADSINKAVAELLMIRQLKIFICLSDCKSVAQLDRASAF